MGIIKKLFQNTRKPEGIGGKLMLSMMNAGHNANALWGLSHFEIPPVARILDIDCGGGKNISNLLSRAPQGTVCGVDYSPESVEKSKRTNKTAVLRGRAKIRGQAFPRSRSKTGSSISQPLLKPFTFGRIFFMSIGDNGSSFSPAVYKKKLKAIYLRKRQNMKAQAKTCPRGIS